MTDDEWQSSRDPEAMLQHLMGSVSDRKLRLFGCACVRQVWESITDNCFRQAVEVAERFADGAATLKELAEAKRTAGAALERRGKSGVQGPAYCAIGSAWSTTRNAETAAIYPLWVFIEKDERKWQAAILRDIFGNRLHEVHVQRPWLTPNVVELAEDIYQRRDFDQMPELAKALKKAGCSEPVVLTHCRKNNQHVRACWVLDLLLNRE